MNKKLLLTLIFASSFSVITTAATKKRVAVHDPSITYDNTYKRYYIVGTHKTGAYSTDLMNWTSKPPIWNTVNTKAFITPAVKTVKKDGEEVDFPQFNAMDWAARTDAAYNINGNLWAPDIIWNPTMNKWCLYLSINGDQWHSSIVLLTGNSSMGPFTYQGPVVISGFDNGSHSWKDTDVPLVLGNNSTLPTRYTSVSNYGRRWPNNIDPCVFYDEQGKLWMSYGSWSGGIWMIELDETTGLRDYNVTYPLVGTGDGITSDPYFGKKIAGGFYVSGEGSYIRHIGNYYYLFVTYGFLSSVGGYEMRVFRSSQPNGPYTDGSSRSAIFNQYLMNYGKNGDQRGMKIMGAYKNWGYMTGGELAQGHNSIMTADDGRSYLVYHTRFTSNNIQNPYEGYEVRVHQLFQTQNGWLVASPFEYNGEKTSDNDTRTTQPFTAAQIAGTYNLLVHKYNLDYENQEAVAPVTITLTDDGKVTGAKTGTWSITEGTGYIKLYMGSTTYQGVVYEATMDYQTKQAIAITACSTGGVNVWAYKETDLTGISTVYSDKAGNADAIYNLYGRRIDIRQLKPGIYIRNGRKVIIQKTDMQ